MSTKYPNTKTATDIFIVLRSSTILYTIDLSCLWTKLFGNFPNYFTDHLKNTKTAYYLRVWLPQVRCCHLRWGLRWRRRWHCVMAWIRAMMMPSFIVMRRPWNWRRRNIATWSYVAGDRAGRRFCRRHRWCTVRFSTISRTVSSILSVKLRFLTKKCQLTTQRGTIDANKVFYLHWDANPAESSLFSSYFSATKKPRGP